MGRGRGVLVVILHLMTGLHGSPLGAQDPTEKGRVMEAETREALQEWARRRYDALISGSAERLEALPHGRDTERLWALYFLSVEDGDWEEQALALQDSLAERALPEHRQVTALGGALAVVRAKHSRWPPNKLKFLKAGLEVLDSLTADAPEDPVVRYLRLASTYYLPFFLDRDESVQEDLEVLARVLPDRSDAFSPAVYEAVIRFILDNGSPAAESRARLQEALAARLGPAGGGALP